MVLGLGGQNQRIAPTTIASESIDSSISTIQLLISIFDSKSKPKRPPGTPGSTPKTPQITDMLMKSLSRSAQNPGR